MKLAKQRISVRGSLADHIARTACTGGGNTAEVLKDVLQSGSDEIIMVPENDIIVIGRIRDVGHYPDW